VGAALVHTVVVAVHDPVVRVVTVTARRRGRPPTAVLTAISERTFGGIVAYTVKVAATSAGQR